MNPFDSIDDAIQFAFQQAMGSFSFLLIVAESPLIVEAHEIQPVSGQPWFVVA